MFIRNSFHYPSFDFINFDSLRDQVSQHLTPLQKKIAAIAIVLLSATVLVYAYYYCFRARKVEEGEIDDLTLDFDKLKQNQAAKSLSEDEQALKRYFELLEKYPQLKRVGENNDHKKGVYEIVYDEEEIRAIQSMAYHKFYNELGSHELAVQACRPGVVFEDAFWIILRDCVIAPKGAKFTYNRLIPKSQLNQCVGAAVMPIITLPNGETKISLILHYRHATQTWEFELPRGSSELGETPEQTAQRELREETGYEVESLVHLGTFPPNSGSLSELVPVFSGKVTVDTVENEDEIDETEAINGNFLFSYDEIMQALKCPDSCLEVMIDGEKKRYPVRDPFLYCALLLSEF